MFSNELGNVAFTWIHLYMVIKLLILKWNRNHLKLQFISNSGLNSSTEIENRTADTQKSKYASTLNKKYRTIFFSSSSLHKIRKCRCPNFIKFGFKF